MPITLNHIVVPARDKRASARFLARLLAVPAGAASEPFVPVRVNDELTFDFDDEQPFHAGHYAFLVDATTFDAVLNRVRSDTAIEYGSGPEHGWDREINHLNGGRGVYVADPDGHAYELFTAPPD